MKAKAIRRTISAVIVAGTLCLHAAQASTIVIGSGPDSSFFLIESPNVGSRTYQIHYTYDPFDPKDGAFLLQQIVGSDSSVQFEIFGTSNIFVNSITYNGVTETGVSEPPYEPYWAHWVAGGAAGFPEAEPVAAFVWSSGSGLSGPYRVIEPGSWDALKYSDFSTHPTIQPVPEPSGALVLCSAVLIVAGYRRRS
jgi:hypothetical protein